MREKQAVATIVCVHGAGGGGWEWAIWARVLGVCGHAVLAPDLMPVAAGVGATRLADYRAQVLDGCGGAGVAPMLVGASLGGLLALSVAREVGARALVLVNPLPPGGLDAGGEARAVIPWRSARSLAGTCRALPDADDAARIHAYRRWRDESGAVLAEARRGIAIDAPGCPALVLASEHDVDVPLARSRELAASLGADFHALEGASHVGPLLGRCAAQAAVAVGDWLRSHRGLTAL